jgi:hypothetical protein
MKKAIESMKVVPNQNPEREKRRKKTLVCQATDPPPSRREKRRKKTLVCQRPTLPPAEAFGMTCEEWSGVLRNFLAGTSAR